MYHMIFRNIIVPYEFKCKNGWNGMENVFFNNLSAPTSFSLVFSNGKTVQKPFKYMKNHLRSAWLIRAPVLSIRNN